MTSEESLDALAREEWASAMKVVFKDRVFKARRDAYEKYCRNMATEDKAREEAQKARKAAEKAQKEAKKSEERRRKEIKKFQLQEQWKRQKEHEKALKDAAKLQKAAGAAAAKAARAALADTRQVAGFAGRQRHAMRPVANVPDDDEVNVEVVERERPRPHPIQWPMAEVLDEMGPVRRSNRRC
jgi:multidrug efflux pump subunit AcrA (membrane-fusion protein)